MRNYRYPFFYNQNGDIYPATGHVTIWQLIKKTYLLCRATKSCAHAHAELQAHWKL